jgi:hypothetical protein
VQFRPGRGQDAARVSENLSRALFAANGLFRNGDAALGDFVFGEGAWPRTHGAIVLVSQASSPAMLERWLFALAAALEVDGLRGKLTAAPDVDFPDFVPTVPNQQLTAFVAYRVLDPAPGWPAPWNVDETTTAKILRLPQQQAEAPGMRTFVFTHGHTTEVGPAVAPAMKRLLPGSGGAGAVLTREQPERLVSCSLHVNGTYLQMVHDPALTWRERLRECQDVVTALPDVTVLAFVQRASRLQGSWDVMDTSLPPQPAGLREYHWQDRPHLRSRFVPDARGIMVLTETHLEKAHDLSNWTVEPFGPGTHLVQAPDLAPWYAQDAPDPDVLAKARQDFGAMILTLADIELNPPPAP